MLSQKLDSPLSILLQLKNALALDSHLLGHRLEGPAFQGREELLVLLDPLDGSEIPLPVPFANLALVGPSRLGARADGTWIS